MTPSLAAMLGGRRRPGSTALLLMLLALLAHLAVSDAATTLRLVQVVHRHGSRTPVISYNASKICGDVPCGYLNVQGQTMLLNAGKALRERYNKDTAVASEPFFPSESYDLDVSYTRSTDVLRTLQSADGLLRGLFPNMTAFFPAMHSVDKSNDTLLRAELIPYPYIMYNIDTKGSNDMCNPWVDAVMNFTTLLSIAKEVYSEKHCADPATRCDCARILYDIGAAMAADGRIAKYKLLGKHLDALRSIDARFWTVEFGYNTSDKLNLKMGSQGQAVAQQLLANAQLHIQKKSTFKLYHYSGHDTTLSPLAATLRDDSPIAARPPFAQLYAFELLQDDKTAEYSMRVLRGHPGQTPDTDFEFVWEKDFQLRCMDAKDKIYNAASNTCPLADLQRLVDSSKPTDEAGLCYLEDHYRSLLECPTQAGEKLTAACTAYRRVCPARSCSQGFVLEATTLQCKCASASCMESSLTDAAAGIVVPTLASGAVIALMAAFAFTF